MAESHSPAYKLFHYKFNFSIPGIHFYSQAYLDTVGMLSTGNKVDDAAIMKRPIDTRGTIMDIARHHSEDHQVALSNPRDAVTMYEIVRDHLNSWRVALARESNLPDAPIEDLAILDEFATSIFEIARRYKPEVQKKEGFSSRMRQLGGSGGLRKSIVVPGVETPAKPKSLPVHHPVIGAIEDYFAKRNGDA